MNYPDFPFVDLAVGGVNRRNNPVAIQEVRSRVNGSGDSYITVHRYPDAFREHVETTGSVRGWDGPSWADYLVFDIDVEGDLEEARRATMALVWALLDSYGVGQDQLRIFFSGRKGFHVLVPTELLGPLVPSPELAGLLKDLALEIADQAGVEVDTGVYDRTRLFRLPNTRHSGSGLFKVELGWDELGNMDATTIRDLASSPRDFTWAPDYLEPLPALEALLERVAEREPTERSNGPAPAIEGEIPQGARDDTLISLAGTMRRRGMEEEEILAALREVNRRRCRPPLDDREVQRVARSGAKYDPPPEGIPGQQQEEPELLFLVEEARFARFLASDPPPRRWLLRTADDGILPLGVVGILAAMGGAGKSQLIYQMGVSVTAGLPFLGWEVPEPGAFLYLAGEDDDAELHRRGHTLVSHYRRLAHLAGEPFDLDAVGERLHVVSRVAGDNLLTRAHADGEVHPTALADRLIRSATQIPDLRVVVLDPASRFKGGKANHEEDATRFVEVAERIREATGATVLVTSHVSQAGIKEGGGQEIVRGSTALVDGVRWVATLQRLRRDRAKDYDLHEDEADRYLRLEIPKSNYTAPFSGVWLRREAGGILVPTELTETPSTQRQMKSEREYVEIVARLQALLKERGPMTRYAIRDHCGLAGALKAGDRTVRAVIERAVREEYLLDVDGELRLPLEDGS